MPLTRDVLHRIGEDCVYRDAEVPDRIPPADAVKADGITSTFYFHPQRLESHRKEIDELLAELPPQFHENSGGGGSFLNACVDKNDVQWGEHRDIEILMCLGIAIGRVEYCLPRDKWGLFPGGMPYFVIRITAKSKEVKGND